MSDDHWSRVEQIYHGALEHPPEQRTRFIDEACCDNSSLRREVESLLAYHDRGDALLEGQALRRMIEDMTSIGIGPGDLVGPYEIMARVGKGGMSEVSTEL
jgi:hypothetical protein